MSDIHKHTETMNLLHFSHTQLFSHAYTLYCHLHKDYYNYLFCINLNYGMNLKLIYYSNKTLQ